MADIYQEIWDADQRGSGIKPVLDTDTADPALGFVKVSTQLDTTNEDLRVLPEVVIPQAKQRTYELCRNLFDNFALPERDEEIESPDEREEIHDLVRTIVDTPPMDVARDYVARMTGTTYSRERWYTTLMEMWFRRFAMGGDPHLTGFEHVIVGEQQQGKAQGYHFWYKYYLDDGFARQTDGRKNFPGLSDDRILYLGSRLAAGQVQFPETVTISYKWFAPDYDRQAMRPLTKPTGGFFVGCSVEGLLALGTVRAHIGAKAPKQAEINGARYELALYRSANNRHVRTFYPKFKGAALSGAPRPESSAPTTPSTQHATDVRIIAALVNPAGHDPGHEVVTLLNVAPRAATLTGFRLMDRNGAVANLPDGVLDGGHVMRISLPGSGMQLSNRGGEIALVDPLGQVIHRVTYSQAQVREEGHTILF